MIHSLLTRAEIQSEKCAGTCKPIRRNGHVESDAIWHQLDAGQWRCAFKNSEPVLYGWTFDPHRPTCL